MVVNFEFLGDEPLENIITCLNYKIDKVVYFGYQNTIEKYKKSTSDFLKKYCNVNTVVFYAMSQHDLQSVLKKMREGIQYELSHGNRIFFDITGGESLILVAFGMLAEEFCTPMHLYDIKADKLIELDEGAKDSISMSAIPQKVKLTIDSLIELFGGRINYRQQKSIKSLCDKSFLADAEKIYEVASDFWTYWNPFSDFINRYMLNDDLSVSMSARDVITALNESKTKLKTPKKLNEILDALANAGILNDLVHENGIYSFRYKSQRVKECICEGGSVLELHIFNEQSQLCDESKLGVHIDWDGIFHNGQGVDVLNEVDVLSLKGNIPTFISCKSGKMEASQVLHALYELDTVAKRFGGRYAKKILITAQQPNEVYLERAKEMNIEVKGYQKEK